jgi:hypothetical protein
MEISFDKTLYPNNPLEVKSMDLNLMADLWIS